MKSDKGGNNIYIFPDQFGNFLGENIIFWGKYVPSKYMKYSIYIMYNLSFKY